MPGRERRSLVREGNRERVDRRARPRCLKVDSFVRTPVFEAAYRLVASELAA